MNMLKKNLIQRCSVLFVVLTTSFSTQNILAQRRSKINPAVDSVLMNVGWRDAETNRDVLYDVENEENPRKLANLKQAQLISVLPNSYCAISGFKYGSNVGMMRFSVDFRLQKGESVVFSAKDNIYVQIDNKTYKALPSDKVNLVCGKNVKGEINIPIGKKIEKNTDAVLFVKVGEDLHSFNLTGRTEAKLQELALVPYHPVWHKMPKPESKKEEIKKNVQEEEVVKAVKQADN